MSEIRSLHSKQPPRNAAISRCKIWATRTTNTTGEPERAERNWGIALDTKKQEEIEAKKVRIINKGGGRKVKLAAEEQILLTLIYLRHLTTFQLLGIQFVLSVNQRQMIHLTTGFHFYNFSYRQVYLNK